MPMRNDKRGMVASIRAGGVCRCGQHGDDDFDSSSSEEEEMDQCDGDTQEGESQEVRAGCQGRTKEN